MAIKLHLNDYRIKGDLSETRIEFKLVMLYLFISNNDLSELLDSLTGPRKLINHYGIDLDFSKKGRGKS